MRPLIGSHNHGSEHGSRRGIRRGIVTRLGLVVGAGALLLGTTACQPSDVNPWMSAAGMQTASPESADTVPADSTSPDAWNAEPIVDLQENSRYSSWSVLHPGSTVYMPKNAGGWTSCSLTFSGYEGGHKVGVSAGHCFAGDSSHSVLWQRQGSNAKETIGTMTDMRLWGGQAPGNDYWHQDISTFTLDESVPTDNIIASRYKVVDVIGAEDLAPGTEVCKYGYRSKETCGPVKLRQHERIGVELFSLPGDSGAPAYVKRGGDEVALVGALKGSPVGNDNYTYFTTVKPYMDEKGITLG